MLKKQTGVKNLGMIIINKNTLPFAPQNIIFALKLFFLTIKMCSDVDIGELGIS